MPWADVLYGCEPRWWNAHKNCDGFEGVKWSTHDKNTTSNDKIALAEQYGINLVRGTVAKGFSTDPGVIHYGDNSGFQTLNLAVLLGSPYIVLVGFDMRHIAGKSHFFGDHPADLFQRKEYESFRIHFNRASPPDGVQIINATPDSGLKCYPMMELEESIENYCLHRNRPIAHAATG